MDARRSLRAVLLLFPVMTPVIPLLGQTSAPPAEATVRRARALYYTPVDSGLQGFHCDVQFDWKSFMEKASNQAIPDDDARLKYLQSIQLSVDDSLRGSGNLHWNAPAPPPENSADSVTRIREGMQQVWAGFFQSWNGFLTGDLVTLDSRAVAESTPAGFHVAVRTAAGLAEEQFDKTLVLSSVHITTPTLDSTVVPTFRHEAHGLLVSAMDSSYRQPPSADPVEIHMALEYAPVSGFQLPSALTVVVGPATFQYHLGNCTVHLQSTPK